MTRTQRVLARRWRHLLLACILVALAGAVVATWARIDHADSRAEQLAAEANRRGGAVTTLAADVRTLREQIKAKGGTPAVPDPGRKVADLRDRAKVPVPVPVPGPRGPQGPEGAPGEAEDGKNGRNGENGRDGVGTPGKDGADSTVPGPPGEPGKDGADGKDGKDSTVPGPRGEQGPAGPSCPDGYSLQPSTIEPDAVVCKKNSEQNDPSPQGGRQPQSAVVDRKRW